MTSKETTIIIEERDDGPLVVKGVTRMTGPDGETMKVKPAMALCRCGASKNKPFCDGSHDQIGYKSQPEDDRTPDRLRVYQGEKINVHYNRLLCSHAAECVTRLGAVFDTNRKPWIVPDNGERDDIMAVVAKCPSGALSCSEPGDSSQHATAETPGITIEKAGPYRVTGVPLENRRSAEGSCAEKYVLCRCGASKNKPYCDGTHHDIKWED